jgi:hypothetical protein
MSLTATQEIPNKPVEKSDWTVRPLFPARAMASAIAKQFSSPFEFLLGLNLLIIGLCELFSRNISWIFYLLTFALLAAALTERHPNWIGREIIDNVCPKKK